MSVGEMGVFIIGICDMVRGGGAEHLGTNTRSFMSASRTDSL